jgi:hypothetical protein
MDERRNLDTPALVRSALEDVKRLVSLEAKLLKLELFSLGVRARQALTLAVFAAGLVLASLVVLAVGTAEALAWHTQIPTWACYVVVGFVGLALAAFVVWRATCLWKQSKETSDGTGSRIARTGNSEYDPIPAR